MARQWFAEGVQVYEDSTHQWFAEGVQWEQNVSSTPAFDPATGFPWPLAALPAHEPYEVVSY